MSTAVSVRLPEPTVETLDNLTYDSDKRRGAVLADALMVLSLVLTTPAIQHPIIGMLRREYNINAS